MSTQKWVHLFQTLKFRFADPDPVFLGWYRICVFLKGQTLIQFKKKLYMFFLESRIRFYMDCILIFHKGQIRKRYFRSGFFSDPVNGPPEPQPCSNRLEEMKCTFPSFYHSFRRGTDEKCFSNCLLFVRKAAKIRLFFLIARPLRPYPSPNK